MSQPQTDRITQLLDEAEAALKTGHCAQARRILNQPDCANADGKDVVERRNRLWWRMSPDGMVPWLILACLIFYVVLIARTAR